MATDDALERVQALVDEVRRRAAADDARDAARAARHAQAAREGALGPDWRRVQARIDAGRTTEADVFGGRDTSPEAQALVAAAQRNVQGLQETLPPETRNALVTGLEELEAARARLSATLSPGAAAGARTPDPTDDPTRPDDGSAPDGPRS